MLAADRIQTNLRKGVLEWCTLALLRQRDLYGRDLAQQLQNMGLISGYGTIYALLGRLRESGWVGTRWEESPVGPPRRYYVLTELGRQAVSEFEEAWAQISEAVSMALAVGVDQSPPSEVGANT